MAETQIRKANSTDVDALQWISRQTFGETFADSNSEEDMRKFLEETYSHSRLSRELEEPDSAFYFATHDGDVVGYLKVNIGNAQTELKLEKALEIERIYVLKDFLGQKVGQELFNKAIEIAREGGYDWVWLGVWENNPRAIQFYKKNGFVEFDKHIFRLGDDEQIDIMMKLDLRSI